MLRLIAVGLPLVIATIFGAVLYNTFRPGLPPEEERIALYADCTFEDYCEGSACGQDLPAPFTIIRDGDYGRTYMGPTEGPHLQASVVPVDGVSEISESLGEEDGIELFGTVILRDDQSFDYRVSETLISNPAIRTGRGHCTDFTERAETA
ncbi:hypothetical protein [Pelagovum pacificum]|uniref:Uncharacterized protein n=1 Tax=Pelagovum pacificum TaxID=2588711 RepID=A0A5C5GEW5_9RHOB|nr:hypothetical protein [Pelagovum pacificum]QQA44746.1 hypothetical protein I8N54_09325 [Pelagovum pacificum]TNY32146.1 hypothetical protein FHY64_02270 [Pelagovum pacificum]